MASLAAMAITAELLQSPSGESLKIIAASVILVPRLTSQDRHILQGQPKPHLPVGGLEYGP
jgi:hypothetical protein